MIRSSKYDFTLPSSPWLWVFNFGLLLIMAGTLLPLIRLEDTIYPYIYSAGALIALTGQLVAPSYRGTIDRIIRLGRIQVWSCIAFCVGAFFMWYNPMQSRDWLAFTLAGGVLLVYTTVAIPHTLKKEQRRRNDKSDD